MSGINEWTDGLVMSSIDCTCSYNLYFLSNNHLSTMINPFEQLVYFKVFYARSKVKASLGALTLLVIDDAMETVETFMMTT